MKIDRLVILSVSLLAACAANAQVSVRILLGVGDTESVRWDGTIAAQGAKIASLEPWRFEGADAIVGLDLAFEYAPDSPVQRGNAGLLARREQCGRQRPDRESVGYRRRRRTQGDHGAGRFHGGVWMNWRMESRCPKLNGRVVVDRIPAERAAYENAGRGRLSVGSHRQERRCVAGLRRSSITIRTTTACAPRSRPRRRISRNGRVPRAATRSSRANLAAARGANLSPLPRRAEICTARRSRSMARGGRGSSGRRT